MRHHIFALIAAFLVVLAPAQALAQADETVADLRRENDQLRERIAQLEATLITLLEQNRALIDETRALRDEVRGLREQVDETRESVEAQRSGRPPEPEIEPIELAPRPDDPMASPGTLLAALKRDHDGRFAGDLDLDDQKQRDGYLAEVQRWFKVLERDFTQRVTWVIDVVDVERVNAEGRSQNAIRIIYYVIDPETELPFDASPSSIVVEGRSALRVLDHENQSRWRITGVLGARPGLNLEREERGLVDTPPYIGPYVEFAYAFRTISIAPVPPDTAPNAN